MRLRDSVVAGDGQAMEMTGAVPARDARSHSTGARSAFAIVAIALLDATVVGCNDALVK